MPRKQLYVAVLTTKCGVFAHPFIFTPSGAKESPPLAALVDRLGIEFDERTDTLDIAPCNVGPDEEIPDLDD